MRPRITTPRFSHRKTRPTIGCDRAQLRAGLLRASVNALAQPSALSPEAFKSVGRIVAMRVVAYFDPPDAQANYAAWRQENSASLADLPDEAWVIDTGRAEGGTFVRVRVEDTYADRFE
jgi:hypothetical protein